MEHHSLAAAAAADVLHRLHAPPKYFSFSHPNLKIWSYLRIVNTLLP